MYDVDALIVGGGPAGSAAAIGCARAGLTTLVLERSSFPRDRPGETLHPGVEPVFEALGISDRVLSHGFLRHAGHWIQWAGAKRFQGFGADDRGPWRGFQAWRAALDALLLERCRDLGVAVIQPCRVDAASFCRNRVAGAESSVGPVRARFTVDATGTRHWLARQLALGWDVRSQRLIARYGYARGECPGRDDAPALTADADGWTWTARVRRQLYAWTRLSMRDSVPGSRWMPEELHHLTPDRPSRGADVTWRCVEPVAGPGYFIAGDAACVLDPASSHGILRALMSGMLAAQRIVDVLRGRATEAAAVADYRRWVRDRFDHDVRALESLYTVFAGWRGAAPPWRASPRGLYRADAHARLASSRVF